MQYVRIQRPPIVLFENVPTVATKFKENVLQPMIRMLETNGAQLVQKCKHVSVRKLHACT